MDKLKGVAKGGWHPSGDRAIHRDSWKSDLKGMATGKKKDPYEDARNHQSAPLTSLRDPDSFGAPPRHTGVHGSNPASPSSPARPQPSGGWGSAVPAPSPRQQQQQQEEPVKPPSGPYKVDTSGLRTDNLPRPPVRRADGQTPPATSSRSSAVAPPPPTLPSRQQPQQRAAVPAPSLPPRMNDHPDEYTPPPPPTYNEATQPSQQDPAALNAGAVNRLGQAGVSVPGFGIGNNASAAPTQPAAPQGHTGQLSELQQRFARMNAGGTDQAQQGSTSPSTTNSVAAAAAHKKPPPPPPPKKVGLGSSDSRPTSSDAGSSAPPLPLSSKPRPPP